MNRPSFQFYPADWTSNPNLKRCTFAEKGVWLEVMCLMHDQVEYGVLRWPLKEIAEAVKCKVGDLQALIRKDVLKGDDQHLQSPFVYVPRSGRKDGEPVTLVDTQAGPIWYSSRMVKDEYVRTQRAESAGNGASSKASPKGGLGEGAGEPIGGGFGPRGSSSSSSPSGEEKEAKASSASTAVAFDAETGDFTVPDVLMLRWRDAYPALILDVELSRASAWLLANPKNRKSNYARFLGNWLAKAQDKAPRVAGQVTPPKSLFEGAI